MDCKRAFWQVYARVYDYVLLSFLPYRQLLDTVVERLNPRPGWRVLDAGCGTGNFLCHLLHTCPAVRVVGIDFSPAMLQRAQKKIIKNEGSKDVLLREANLNFAVPFGAEYFEGIICVNVLYAVDNPLFLLTEIYRLLKRGGKLVLINPPFQPQISPVFKEHVSGLKRRSPLFWSLILAGQVICLAPYLSIFLLANNFIKKQQSFHFFKSEELLSLVKRCGFELVSLEQVYGGQGWLLEAVRPFPKAGGEETCRM